MLSMSPPPKQLPAFPWAPFLRRGARTLFAAAIIGLAVGLGGLTDNPLWTFELYTLSITLFCWACVDGGRLLVARTQFLRRQLTDVAPGSRAAPAHPEWPGRISMVLVLVIGTAVGHTLGVGLANLLTGFNEPNLLSLAPQQAFTMVGFSLIPGIAATYFFWSRGELSAATARAELAQREAAENQLKLIESQLEPHMLFNTLANLRVLIGLNPDRAQAMLDHLIAFLRATLEASRSGSHPLSAEFERAKDYAALMQVRMGDRLQTQFDLPSELADVSIPPLVLQPLVENAIKHGLEPNVSGGELRVVARLQANVLTITVRDTGVGIASKAEPTSGTHFGLQQVRSRLANLYGASASLTLEAATDSLGGAVATITLPMALQRA